MVGHESGIQGACILQVGWRETEVEAHSCSNLLFIIQVPFLSLHRLTDNKADLLFTSTDVNKIQ